MIIKTCRKLFHRLVGQRVAASSPRVPRSETTGGVEESTASDKSSQKSGRSQPPESQGVGAAIRAGQAKLAHNKLRRWRERYLRARRNAVQLALSRFDKASCTEEERDALRVLLEDTESEAATAALVTRSDGRSLQLAGVASFRQSLTLRSRRSQLAGAGPEWRLNGKEKGARFAKRHGIDCPEVYARNIKAEDIELRAGSVVKPVSGAASRGVYLVLGDSSIFEPSKNRFLNGESEWRQAVREDLTSGRVGYDRWMVEELVTEDEEGLKPGCDLKFYCFYGQIGLVLEVERLEKTRYCEWDGAGNIIVTGKYSGREFSGKGVDPEQLALVAEVSLKIPTPFIRIDFIRSHASPNGMVFCEFTPRPGNYHRFDLDTDKRLGDLYLGAEARLENDLLRGKPFSKIFLRK